MSGGLRGGSHMLRVRELGLMARGLCIIFDSWVAVLLSKGHCSRLGTCSTCSRAMRCIGPSAPRKLAYGRPRTMDRLRSMKKQRCSA